MRPRGLCWLARCRSQVSCERKRAARQDHAGIFPQTAGITEAPNGLQIQNLIQSAAQPTVSHLQSPPEVLVTHHNEAGSESPADVMGVV